MPVITCDILVSRGRLTSCSVQNAGDAQRFCIQGNETSAVGRRDERDAGSKVGWRHVHANVSCGQNPGVKGSRHRPGDGTMGLLSCCSADGAPQCLCAACQSSSRYAVVSRPDWRRAALHGPLRRQPSCEMDRLMHLGGCAGPNTRAGIGPALYGAPYKPSWVCRADPDPAQARYVTYLMRRPASSVNKQTNGKK